MISKIVDLNNEFRETGTKFKVFPTPPHVGGKAETIYVSTSPSKIRIREGFGDSKFRVVEKKSIDYGGEIGTPICPVPFSIESGTDGHFDSLDSSADHQKFFCAALYASARRTLDLWEKYAGHKISWISDSYAEYLELVPYLNGFGAYSEYSCIEFGYWSEGSHYCGSSIQKSGQGEIDLNLPNCENFEVIAHEVGHNILSAEMGTPSLGTFTIEFRGFHESICDIIAILASLHFDSVVESLLEHTRGNLYGYNEMSSVMPMPNTFWVRTAFNEYRMSSVYRLEILTAHTPPPALVPLINRLMLSQKQGLQKGNTVQQEIYGATPEETQQIVRITNLAYELSRVLTGTLFDITVEIFQKKLVESKAISEELNRKSCHTENYALMSNIGEIQKEFEQAYLGNKDKFKTALLEARDEVGLLLTKAVSQLSPHNLLFFNVASTLLKADREISGGVYQTIMRDCFKWRGIKQPYPPLAMI